MEKECTKCGEVKALDEFNIYKDGFRAQCKVCTREYDFQRRLKFPRKKLLEGIRHRAKKYGIPFDLTEDDIVIPEDCPIFKKPFIYAKNGRNEFSPSIDKILPQKGYVKGNIIVISWRANRIKNDATVKELKTIADFYINLIAE